MSENIKDIKNLYGGVIKINNSITKCAISENE